MADWVVALEQTKPYDYKQIEVFPNQYDALSYAETYAEGHGFLKASRRTWLSATEENTALMVRKKRW